jgi:hypothetical protein
MEILGIVLFVILSGLSLIALFGALGLLFPVPVERTMLNLEKSLGRSFLLGLVNFIFFVLVVMGFSWLSQQVIQFLGAIFLFIAVVILIGLGIFVLMGLSAFAKLFGERISEGRTGFHSLSRGGALLLFAGLAPYVGWMLFTPFVVWSGLGASISALVRRRDQPALMEEAT